MVEADEFTRAWIVGPDPAERIQLDRDPVPGRDYVVVLTDVELA